MSDKFPQTSRNDVAPEKNSFPEKKIGKDWGAENSAANDCNTPSDKSEFYKDRVEGYGDNKF